ncbi:MAG: hypothetical protein JRH14_08790 [Deltaproteobacteria bacterium]|nr:hypothetical protein [Deltaproteobacteria bacterium]MBW2160046.1 hypothetical protein [Deltaproteobacteria bacterium]
MREAGLETNDDGRRQEPTAVITFHMPVQATDSVSGDDERRHLGGTGTSSTH